MKPASVKLSAEEIKSFASDIRVDAMGNLVTRKGSKSKGGLRIMLAGHMDEIGLMATHVDTNGFIRFTGLGGIRLAMLTGSRVRFMDGTPGVIGTDRLTDMTKAPTMEQCFIDVGASSLKDCPVKVGDVCAFDRPFIDLGNRLVAKSMDDRIGCAVLIETMRSTKNFPPRTIFRLYHPGGGGFAWCHHFRLWCGPRPRLVGGCDRHW